MHIRPDFPAQTACRRADVLACRRAGVCAMPYRQPTDYQPTQWQCAGGVVVAARGDWSRRPAAVTECGASLVVNLSNRDSRGAGHNVSCHITYTVKLKLASQM